MGISREHGKQPSSASPLGSGPPELEQAGFGLAGSDGSSTEVGKPIICETPVTSRPKPRGLLPVPPEVRELAAQKLDKIRVIPTDQAVRRVIDSLTLQYYYEGFDVAYRMTPQGVEVLAVGHEEIGQLVRGASESERASMTIGQP